MIKFLKACGIFLLIFSLLTAALVVYGHRSIPDEITLQSWSGISMNMSPIYTVSLNEHEQTDGQNENAYTVNVSLLNIIPIKTSKVYLSKRHYVIAGGDIFGLKLYSDGVIIVSTAYVETAEGQVSPAEAAGIEKGDILIEIDGKKVTGSDEAAGMFQNCEGREMTLKLLRHNEEYTTVFRPVISVSDGKYKAGLWIRDSAAGIGTITYIDPSTGIYGSLGHAICDCDTDEIIPIENGEAVSAIVTGCYKGSGGKAGELCGVFGNKRVGSILINGENGAYGEADNVSFPYELVPVATKNEVRTGKAQIISTVSGSEKKYYDIEIIKVSIDDAEGRNICIKVTDEELIEKTGGIVQGMSGSPIIQDDMLVGAVTHVLVNDPLKGYAIFADTMLEISDELYENINKSNAA